MDTVAQPYTAALAESKVNTELSAVQCPNYATLGILCRSTHETIYNMVHNLYTWLYYSTTLHITSALASSSV